MKHLLSFLVVFGAYAQSERVPDWRATLSRAIQLRETGSDEAQAFFSEAAAQARTAEDGLALAYALNEFAMDHQRHGRHQQAEQLFREVLNIYDTDPKALPLDRAATMHNLAITRAALARWDEAESLHRSAIAIIERVAGPRHRALVVGLSFLGMLYVAQGRIDEAEPLLTRALRLGGEVLSPNGAELAPSLNGIAAVRRLRGDYDGARAAATRALRIVESAYGPEDVRAAAILFELGTFEFETARLASATAYLNRALDIVRKRRAPDHPDALNILIQLGDIAVIKHRYAEAEAAFSEVARAAQRPEQAGVLGVALHHLAVLYGARKQHDRAEPLLRRSLAVTVDASGSRNAEWASCAFDLARTLLALGRTAEAESLARSGLIVAEQTTGIRHPSALKALGEHAQMLRRLKRKEEARQVEDRVRSLVAAGFGSVSAHTVSVAELNAMR
jgi:tetratricopeptide (TPR) repeat protein